MPDRFLNLFEIPEKKMAVLETCRDSVEMADWEVFVKSAAALLASDQPQLVLDLRKLQRVLSLFIGEAVRLNAQATERDKRFTVLADGQVGEVFKMLLGADLLEIVTDGKPPQELESPAERAARRSSRWSDKS